MRVRGYMNIRHETLQNPFKKQAIPSAYFDIIYYNSNSNRLQEGQQEIKKDDSVQNRLISGQQDSNLRPSAPKADALARLRYAPLNT